MKLKERDQEYFEPAKSNKISSLSDDNLLNTIKIKVQNERELVIEILNLLREVETRQLHLKRGYSSLFAFCVSELGYSDSQAYRRISTMRAIKEIPELENKIEEGKLNIAVVAQVQTFLQQQRRELNSQNLDLLKNTETQSGFSGSIETKPNVAAKNIYSKEDKLKLFNSLEGKSKREVERELAAKCDRPFIRSEIIKSVSATQTELRLTINQDFMNNLEKLKVHFAHRLKTGSMTELLELLTKDACKKIDGKLTATKHEVSARALGARATHSNTAIPGTLQGVKEIAESNSESKLLFEPSAPKQRSNVIKSRSRFISINIKRQVWKTAQGKCQFVDLKTGRICESEKYLQIDHVFPKSWGGDNKIENLQLLCGSHNRLKGERPQDVN